MSEYSFPFKSDGGDRKFKAIGWRNTMRPMFTKGVFPISPQLQVTAGEGMTVVLSAGFAFIDGVSYCNDADLTIDVTAADGALDRKDCIMIRVDEAGRVANATRIEGTPSENAVAPENTWDTNYKDICLSILNVYAGITEMASGHIEDTRLETDRCGIAAPYAVPDTSGWYAAWDAEFQAWFATAQTVLGEDAAGELLNLINAISVLSLGAAGKSTTASVTLAAANWSGSLYTLTSASVSALSGTTALTAIEVLPSESITKDELEAIQAANVQSGGQTDDTLILKAFNDPPSIDVPIDLIVRGDLY